MEDIFTYKNTAITSGQVASADFARIAVSKGGRVNSLVQSCEVSYGQQIEEVTQVGSTQIFWLPGNPRGNISISTLVGADGFFNDWAGECGKIDSATIDVKGGACGFKGNGSLTFSGGVVESLTANISTGRKTIVQGAQVRVASMRKSG